MENYMVWIWLGIFVISVVVEASTQELVSIWFALAAIITLALSLSINNLALGIGASISGISIILTTILTFVFSVITMIIGLKLGSRYLSKIFGEYSPLISAVIIIAMGIFEFFF